MRRRIDLVALSALLTALATAALAAGHRWGP